jgi:hypothetical protein
MHVVDAGRQFVLAEGGKRPIAVLFEPKSYTGGKECLSVTLTTKYSRLADDTKRLHTRGPSVVPCMQLIFQAEGYWDHV